MGLEDWMWTTSKNVLYLKYIFFPSHITTVKWKVFLVFLKKKNEMSWTNPEDHVLQHNLIMIQSALLEEQHEQHTLSKCRNTQILT